MRHLLDLSREYISAAMCDADVLRAENYRLGIVDALHELLFLTEPEYMHELRATERDASARRIQLFGMRQALRASLRKPMTIQAA